MGRPLLEPVRLVGREGVNYLFEYELLVQTPEDFFFDGVDLNLDEFNGRELSCLIELEGGGERQINALIAHAAYWGEEGRHRQYKLTLRPWLHLATLSANCRVFQNKTVVQILDDLLSAYLYPVDKRFYERYGVRDYQVQFNETDFECFERLCQEWGINYHFEHDNGAHRLVLSDATAAFKPNRSEVYQVLDIRPPGWKLDAEYLHRFVPVHQLTSGGYSTGDYDYTRPKADLRQTRRDPRPTAHADGEIYQWHDARAGTHFAQPNAGSTGPNDPQEEGRQLSLLRMQALRTHGARASASGNLRGVCPGATFRLKDHPRQSVNAEYVVLDTTFVIEDVGHSSQPGAAERTQRWQVRLDLALHPVKEPLRPALTRPKPLTYGPQRAVVVGPADQNIWTDELGRIKVQFPWDRAGQNDENSSCWVRVSSPWAGNQLGGIHVPRIGQEVLIDFLGGDPDQPICTGRVHNQLNGPPWLLPGQAALSGFRSRELTPDGGGNSAAGRSNHFLFDDTDKKIQVQVKSDHCHSMMSLGYIARVENNAGRQDERGEGCELCTEGAGAMRAAKGLLLTTDGRARAAGGILSRDELVSCLEQALAIARDLGKTAVQCQVAPREIGPQQSLSEAVEALGHGAGDEAQAKGKSPGGQPVVAISGAAGIATATPRDHTQYAGENIDTVAGRNQQHYADRSILHTAGKDIEQFAHRGDIRTVASEGKVITQAQHNSVEITAQKGVVVTSTDDEIVFRAKKAITFQLEDGTYARLAGGKVVFGMPGQFNVKSAGRLFEGPATLPVDFPTFDLVDQARQLKLHREGGTRASMPERDFEVVKGDRSKLPDKSGTGGIFKLKPGGLFDVDR